MSYDLFLFKPEAGVDPLITAMRILEDQEENGLEINPGEPQPELEQRKFQIANNLLQMNSAITVSRFDFAVLAEHEGISETEARKKYRHIELNGLQEGDSFQVTLFDKDASIIVPYWYRGPEAERNWEKVWAMLRLLHWDVGYSAYDSQLDKVLDLSADLPLVLATYESVMASAGVDESAGGDR